MQIKYVVHSIEKDCQDIKLTLRTVVILPPPRTPEPEIIPPDPLMTFVPETDEDKVVFKLMKALRKAGMFPPPTPTFRAPLFYATKPPAETTLTLTKEEYNKLGNPGLDQTIIMELTKSSKP